CLKIISDNLVGILSRVAEGLGPVKPQQPVLPRGCWCYLLPGLAGRDKIVCPARLLLSTPPSRRTPLDDTRLRFDNLAPACGGTSVSSSFVRGLKCRLCGQAYPVSATNFCTEDFGPLEVDYDYDAIAAALDRGKIEVRPFNMWRYQEFLPLDGEPTVGRQV